jgi:hypothetical protein
MYFGHLVQADTTAPSKNIGLSLWALSKAVLRRPFRLVFAVPALIMEGIAHLTARADLRDPDSLTHYRRWVTTSPKRVTSSLKQETVESSP